MKSKLPIIVKVPVPQTEFNIDAVDVEVYCVNTTVYTWEVKSDSESFTTVDEESGDTVSHGSPPTTRLLAPGKAVLVADVRGWEWDGHVGLQVTFKEKFSSLVIVKSYDLKGSKGDYTIERIGKKGRIVKPLA